VLYDLAFLLMDLGHRGHQSFANLVLNRYLDLTEEDDGLALLPLFLSLRAIIRAHVTATMAEHGLGPGRSPFRRRRGAALSRRRRGGAVAASRPAGCGRRPQRQRQIGSCGRARFRTRPAVPAREILRSDVLRKLRFGAEPESPLPPEAYTAEVTTLSTRISCTRAAAALRAGYSAVIDAVALGEEERRSFAAVAAAAVSPSPGSGSTRPPRR